MLPPLELLLVEVCLFVYLHFILEDNCWYRATVLSLTNSQTAEVVFVDFGNSAIVPFTALRAIHEYFLKLPMQMFVCSLADVKPKGAAWNSQAVAAFQEYVQDQHLVGKINLKGTNELQVDICIHLIFNFLFYLASEGPVIIFV